MLLTHEQFERAVIEARRYREDTIKRSTRRHSRGLLTSVNDGPTDPSTFAEMLLIAYLIKPRRFAAWRSRGFAVRNGNIATVLFDVEPIVILDSMDKPGATEVKIDETAVYAPLRFRDYLSLLCYQKVRIASISFGCLNVDYYVEHQSGRFVDSLRSDSRMGKVCSELRIRSVQLGSQIIYERS
jgi:hypothetical protein